MPDSGRTRGFSTGSDTLQSAEDGPIKVVLSFTIPDRLERLLVWPVLLYRRLRYGCAYRRIELSKGKFAIVDPDDFYWLSEYKWSASGIGRKFYAVRRNGRRGKTYSMHREIARTPKGLECDHINGDGLDNRKANLRSATRQQNIWNNGKRRNACLSKYKGVSRNTKGRLWRAAIIAKGKWTHLGSFKDEDEAAEAYDKAAREKFGQYARLNFPNEAEKPP